ncbi:MAG: hypothetical protein ABIN48_14905 [Ginsengibacter sp.]
MNLKFTLLITSFVLLFFSCKKDDHSPFNPLYDLNVSLKSIGKDAGVGFIKFRQDPDTARVITLDTWVKNLRPNHSYLLQRAVNPIADVIGCSSTAWLTLGEGLQSKSILTNARSMATQNYDAIFQVLPVVQYSIFTFR